MFTKEHGGGNGPWIFIAVSLTGDGAGRGLLLDHKVGIKREGNHGTGDGTHHDHTGPDNGSTGPDNRSTDHDRTCTGVSSTYDCDCAPVADYGCSCRADATAHSSAGHIPSNRTGRLLSDDEHPQVLQGRPVLSRWLPR